MTQGAVRPSALDPAIAARLKRDANGLVAAIAQQHDTGAGRAEGKAERVLPA